MLNLSSRPSVAALVASLLSMRTVGTASRVLNLPNAAQQRRLDAWQAGAAERRAIAAEVKVWNAGVKRRNQRFVARQLARGRTAS